MRWFRFSWRLIILCITGIVIFYTYVNAVLGELRIVNDIFLLENITDTFLTETSPNTGITNINGLSNIKRNMINDGWSLYKESIDNNEIDIIFTNKSENVARIYYRCDTNEIAIFTSDYESSGEIFTYTNVIK